MRRTRVGVDEGVVMRERGVWAGGNTRPHGPERFSGEWRAVRMAWLVDIAVQAEMEGGGGAGRRVRGGWPLQLCEFMSVPGSSGESLMQGAAVGDTPTSLDLG